MEGHVGMRHERNFEPAPEDDGRGSMALFLITVLISAMVSIALIATGFWWLLGVWPSCRV